MEDSILKVVKALCLVDPDDDSFDIDLITHVNTVFTRLHQLGIGPAAGFMILSDAETWTQYFALDELQDPLLLNSVKSYMGLRVRLLFDPPTTSYHIGALEKQQLELETTMSYQRECALRDRALPPTEVYDDTLPDLSLIYQNAKV